MSIPFLAVGNDELGDDLKYKAKCPNCGKFHPIKYGDEIVDGKPVPSKMLAFVNCGKESYLVGINGKELR